MIAKICFIVFCLMGVIAPILMIIDYKRAEKGKKAILFEIDNNEEE